MTVSLEWEQRADRLHRHLLHLSRNEPLTERDGRSGRHWQGSRDKVLQELWPDVAPESGTHPYGGQLSRLLRGQVVFLSRDQRGPLWWIALDRQPPVRDPNQCPTCSERFPSVQARRGHQASHRPRPRQGLRGPVQDADLDALAERLASRIASLLAAHSPAKEGTS